MIAARLPVPLLLALMSASAHAQVASDPVGASAQGDIAVTIYNGGQSLVQDERRLPVTQGRNRIEFPDVSARIRPETVNLSGPGLSIVEQNFDFDLLSPDKLMDKAVGQEVTLVRTNVATGAETRERAKVLAANGGIVMVNFAAQYVSEARRVWGADHSAEIARNNAPPFGGLYIGDPKGAEKAAKKRAKQELKDKEKD